MSTDNELQATLWQYANTYHHANDGRFPKVSEAAAFLQIPRARVLELCDAYYDDGYLGVVVGVRTYSGFGSLPASEYRVEAHL